MPWYDDGEFVHSEILNWEKSVCGGVWEGVSSTEDQDEKVCSGVNNTPVQPRINSSSNKFLGKVQGEWSLLCQYEIKVSKSIWAGGCFFWYSFSNIGSSCGTIKCQF